jgi:flagellum-specific peptidoglycan hydrolase FlgJ
MSSTYTRQDFVKKYGGFIAKTVKGTGLHAGTVISQAIIESQGKVGGSYRVGGSKLSREANNYFGIKCHGWSGRGYNIDTGEQKPDGTRYIDKQACFRAYDNVEDSIRDYVKFLKDNPRYRRAGVFEAPTVRDQALALKRAGYATSIKYADTVTSVYNSVKDYVAQYAVAQNSFFKKNKFLIIGTVALLGAGVGIYFLTRKKA